MNPSSGTGSPTDDHVFLIGRPPLGEFLGFVEVVAGIGSEDRGALANEWRQANDRVKALEGFAASRPFRSIGR